MTNKSELSIELPPEEVFAFCGKNDKTIKIIEKQLRVKIVARGNTIKIIGNQGAAEKAESQISKLINLHSKNAKDLPRKNFEKMIGEIGENGVDVIENFFSSAIKVPLKNKQITPLTPNQHKYVDNIRKNDIVFGIGPAGTGKTYLAMTMAVNMLASGRVSRIILVRPAVEAGERLGFLPGDIAEKFDPYVRPLYDALFEMIEPEKLKIYREAGIIEIAPLAFMRGRTLNKAFVILDEGQNTSIEQMKMFLTRLGAESKAVITGDITQTDLPEDEVSGLIHAESILKNINGIAFTFFDQKDIVRHDLVRKIVTAYDKYQDHTKIMKKEKKREKYDFKGETTFNGLIKKLGSPSRHHEQPQHEENKFKTGDSLIVNDSKQEE